LKRDKDSLAIKTIRHFYPVKAMVEVIPL
jgi:hypothetical protein